MTDSPPAELYDFVLGLGDDLLILGQQLSAWCGHAPILEEDIALANIALDCLGQSTLLLELAATIEGNGRTADQLAFFRDVTGFRNCLLAEQPNGDFAKTICRHYLTSTAQLQLFRALASSPVEPISAIATRSSKETTYHVRHLTGWMLRLGDGTSESHARLQRALDELWSFHAEMFADAPSDAPSIAAGLIPSRASMIDEWRQAVSQTLAEATLAIPSGGMQRSGGRRGVHSEHLGRVLAEMQILPRSYPGASW